MVAPGGAALDESTAAGAAAARRLRSEKLIWLTTVRPDGQPQPSGVWFHWDGADFLIFSEPNAPKVRNIRGNPQVAVHLDSDGSGGGLVVAEGSAELAEGVDAERDAAYLTKYDGDIAALGWTVEQLRTQYSLPIRVTPTRWRMVP
jgi:PPOX class probable F420-dependent enzyme